MNLSKKQYRSIDLTIFAVLIAVFEAINVLAISQWFSEQMFTISLLIPLTALVVMRWGAFALIHSALSGFVFCYFQSATMEQYIIYIVGNCFAILIMLMFLAVDKEKVRLSNGFTALYVAGIFILISIGRTVVNLFFGGEVALFVHFAAHEALSAVIGLIIVLICKRQDGLFEDQHHYLMRLHEERENQRKLKDDGML